MESMEHGYDYSWAMPYLGPGESILWRGKPQSCSPFTASDIYIIPFMLLWCGFMICSLWRDFQKGISISGLFFIPFVLAALFILFGRLICRPFLLKHTSYAITTQKVLRRRNRKVDILQGCSMPPFQVKEHRNGLKSILFGQSGFALEFLSDAERALNALNSMRSGYAQQ